MSDLVELTRKLAEVTADRDAAMDWARREHQNAMDWARREHQNAMDWARREHQNADEYAARITQLEAMLPRAYLLGQEDRDRYILNSDPKKRRNPTPTSAELLAKLKETT